MHYLLRRILWCLYAWPVTLLIIAVEAAELSRPTIPTVLDLIISLPSLLALHLHIWHKPLFSQKSFWRPYAFVFLSWDLLNNTVLRSLHTTKPFEIGDLIGLAIEIPLYVAVFLYAFRNWNATPPPIS